MDHYCLGFYFTDDGKVAIVHKDKPDWQAGKLNGVGGHVEHCETYLQGMIRKFEEETGHRHEDWKLIAGQMGHDYALSIFKATGPEFTPKAGREQVIFYKVKDVLSFENLLPSCIWMIGLALDSRIAGPIQVKT